MAEAATDGNEVLRGTIGVGATRDQRAAEHVEGLTLPYQDDNHRQKIPSMLYALRTDMVNN